MYYSSPAQYKHEYDGLDTTDFVEIIDKHSSHSSVELIENNITSGRVFFISAWFPLTFFISILTALTQIRRLVVMV